LKKDQFEKNFDELVKIVGKPKFACRRCGRAVADKDWVCKPAKLK